MKNKTVLLLAIALVVVGVIGLAATVAYLQPSGSSRGPSMGPSAEPFGGPSRGPMGGDVDAMFIEQMIPHHEDAIEMAKLALSRAEHPEIERLAEDIIETQSAEIDQMRAWYRDWYGTDVPDDGGSFGMMGGGMMGGDVDIEDLETAQRFDEAFIEAMIPHHEMGIMMSQMAGSATTSSDLRDLTDAIIEGQTTEIRQMQNWYDEWYGR